MPKRQYSIDLIKQMAECDGNYIRLLKLLPQLQAYREKVLSKKGKVSVPAESIAKSTTAQSDSERKGIDNSQNVENAENVETVKKADSQDNIDNLVGEKRVFCIADLTDSSEKLTVEIRIVESFKYTTTLEIVQKPEFKKWMTNPTMLVRAYHDASTAEVVSYQGHRNLQPRYSQPNPKMYYPDEKRQVNAFLGEWLTHCLRVGQSLKVPDSLFTT